MKISDLFSLNKDYCKISYIVGEKGAENEILDVDILEIPDGMYWVEPGDFIITMGYFFTASPVKFENFIRILIQNKAAGLGVKLGRFFDNIPPNAIKLAQENDFPIINFPLNMRYKTMMKPIQRKLAGESVYISETIWEYKQGLDILIKNNYQIKEIIDHMKRYIGCETFVMWKSSNAYIYKTSDRYTRDVEKVLKENEFKISLGVTEKKYTCNGNSFACYGIGAGEEIIAYLCVMEGNDKALSNADMGIIKETLPHITIYLYSKTHVAFNQNHSKDAMIIKILNGEYIKKEAKMVAEAKSLEISINAPRIFISINMSNYDNRYTEKVYSKFEMYVNSYNLKNVIYMEFGNIYCLVDLPIKSMSTVHIDECIMALIKEVRLYLKDDSICACVSRICEHLSGLHYACEEVKFLMTRKNKTKQIVCHYEDFMMENLLSEISEQSSMEHIYKIIMDKIKVTDVENNSDNYNTLLYLSENDFNLTQTAQKMFLHRNTLYKRIKKIEELLNIDLENSNIRLMIQLIMKIDKIDG